MSTVNISHITGFMPSLSSLFTRGYKLTAARITATLCIAAWGTEKHGCRRTRSPGRSEIEFRGPVP